MVYSLGMLEGAVIVNNAATSSIPNTHVFAKRLIFIVTRSKSAQQPRKKLEKNGVTKSCAVSNIILQSSAVNC